MNHDIWKSKRFISEVVGAFIGFLVLIVGAYTKVEVGPETVAVLAKILVAGAVLLLPAGFVIEDIVIAARSGARAAKYDKPQ